MILSTFLLKVVDDVFAQKVVKRERQNPRAVHPVNVDYLPLLSPQILNAINLNSDQRNAIAQIIQSHRDELKATGKRLRGAICALDLAIASDQRDESLVVRLKDEVVQTEADMTRLRISAYRRLQGILTTGQRTQYAELNRNSLTGPEAQREWESGPISSYLHLDEVRIRDLSPTQEEAIRRILDEPSAEFVAINRREGQTRSTLDESALADPFDETAVNRNLENYLAVRTASTHLRVKILTQLRDAMTREQLANFRNQRAEQCARSEP